MTASDEERQKIVHAENKAFGIGFSLAALIAFAVLNIFILLFIVPKFEQIFADALPGKPLPGATNFIIGYRIPLIIFALVLPVACIFLRMWRRQYGNILIHLGIVWFLFEIGTTIIALFMPMVAGPIVGMSDGGK